MNWLDRAVGFENFPDGDWKDPSSGSVIDRRNLIGFDRNGLPVFQDPEDPSRGHVITQGVINTGGLFGPGGGQMTIGGQSLTQMLKNVSFQQSKEEDDDDFLLSSLKYANLSMSFPIINNPNAFIKGVTGT